MDQVGHWQGNGLRAFGLHLTRSNIPAAIFNFIWRAQIHNEPMPREGRPAKLRRAAGTAGLHGQSATSSTPVLQMLERQLYRHAGHVA